MNNTNKIIPAILIGTSICGLASEANANAITADSKAWDNQVTVELGTTYRNVNKPAVRYKTIHVPAVLDAHGRIVHPVSTKHVAERYIRNSDAITGNGKITTLLGNDFLVGAGVDGPTVYGLTAVRNGSFVASGSVTTSGDLATTLALSPVKNFALIYHNQRHVSAAGLQVQLGNASLMGSYDFNTKSYSVGLGSEVGLAAKSKAVPVMEVPMKAVPMTPTKVRTRG